MIMQKKVIIIICPDGSEWSREMLLEAWIQDAIACCEKCGVIPPISLYADRAGHLAGSSSSTAGASSGHELVCQMIASQPPTPDTIVSYYVYY